MTHLIEISDAAYERLSAEARRRGIARVEEMLEQWEPEQQEDRQKNVAEIVADIRAFREQMVQKYGIQPDSTGLIREDRER